MATHEVNIPLFPPQPQPDAFFVDAAAQLHRERLPLGLDPADLPASDLRDICRVARALKLLCESGGVQ